MSKSSEIAAQVIADTNIQVSPMQQMIQAKEIGLSIDEMKEMMQLQKVYEANEARKAFHQAMAKFKRNPPKVLKDKINTQYSSSYTSIGNMVNTVNEELGKYDLNARWNFPDNNSNIIICTCILAHKLGHEESVTLSGPIDESGKKNPLQGRKSARTYLKLETFEAVTGVASIDGNIDDDANSAYRQKIETITEDQTNELHSKITDNNLDMKLFMGWFSKACKVDSIDKLPANLFQKVENKINEAIKNKGAGNDKT